MRRIDVNIPFHLHAKYDYSGFFLEAFNYICNLSRKIICHLHKNLPQETA